MSTTDQQGKGPLTRKQLRELRLTGATPVIVEEPTPQAPPAPVLPRAAAPAPVAPAPAPDSSVDVNAVPLTRRQAREQERIRTASVPVIEPVSPGAAPQGSDAADETTAIVDAVPLAVPAPSTPESEAQQTPAVDDAGSEDSSPSAPSADETLAVVEAESVAADPVEAELVEAEPVEAARSSIETDDEADADAADELSALGVSTDAIEDIEDDDDADERPVVNDAFGSSLLAEGAEPARPQASFDELIGMGDSTGSQHIAPNALIFNPGPGEGLLSGPVASTGEVLITGTYELPEGIGSQGHAHGTADGKDVDAVLIDGELPPASSPTPIAASSAISTSKPAGEVIRPPAPEKGNKLMLVLAITAGGLALVLAAALVYAFATNVLG